jgi:long-chain acyl-CoA synthetase
MVNILHPRAVASHFPEKAALIIADTGESLSYATLVANSDRAAQLFAAMGLVEGDTIALFLENHISFPELCWAAKNSGITYACIGRQSSVSDASYIVENSGAKLLVSSSTLREVALAVSARCGDKVQYLMLDGVSAPYLPYESMRDDMPALPLAGRRRGPSMLYSSGTTGQPKGVKTPLPDEAPEIPPRRLAMLQHYYGLDADTVLVNPGPFYHAAPGRFMISLQRLGGTTVAFKKFDAEATLAAIETYRATHGLYVPTMFIRMLRLDKAVRESYSSEHLSCVIHLAAPCPIPVKEQMIAWWGPVIQEMYGGTEAVGHTFINSNQWLAHKGSVGLPAKGCEIRIIAEDGRDLEANAIGAIYMRNGNQFEYHGDSAKTKGVFIDGGWATLGDIGYLDDDGYLYLTDRKAHMIVSGGVNIYPQETENILYGHPQIADVAVIGVPHDEFGEEVKAVVQVRGELNNPVELEKNIINYCRQHLSPIKCPRSVDFVDELPRNEAGKLVKRIVRDAYWQGRNSKLV